MSDFSWKDEHMNESAAKAIGSVLIVLWICWLLGTLLTTCADPAPAYATYGYDCGNQISCEVEQR